MNTQVLSYGGGRQTVAMCILVVEGVLPRPDRIIIADTGREAGSTWDYLQQHVEPMLAAIGLRVEIAPHSLATVDLYGHNGDLLLPAFTKTGKLSTFCSNEWKASVVQRYLRNEKGEFPAPSITSADMWIGFTVDETRRLNADKRKCWHKTYPLMDLMLTRRDCETLIVNRGMVLPPKSACFMCPYRSNEEWRLIRDQYPEQFTEAIRIDEEIREDDEQGGVFLHWSRVPLAQADLDAKDRREPARQCGLGNCMT